MAEPFVVVEDLAASYGQGPLRTQVFEAASFAVERAEKVALRGVSGSGKTTLLALLGGLDRPESGRLVVGNLDLAGLNRAQLSRYRRETVGFVFQASHLLPTLDARENVETALEPLGLPRADIRRRAEEALDRVGLLALAHRLPHELSGGEQQRVAVARACVKDPPLLLADEPTGNLDEASGALVLDLLFGPQGVGTGRTVIVATHDASIAARASRVLQVRSRGVRAA